MIPALGASSTLSHPTWYLNPRPPVVFCGRPGVYQPLFVETCIVGVPFLESKQGSVSGRSCDLLVWYDSAFDSQRAWAFCEQTNKTGQRTRSDTQVARQSCERRWEAFSKWLGSAAPGLFSDPWSLTRSYSPNVHEAPAPWDPEQALPTLQIFA